MASTSDTLSGDAGSMPALRSIETPEETAARWRRENKARGAKDQRGALYISESDMDRKTANSIRAQRDWAERTGGESVERLGNEYTGDVVYTDGRPPVEITASNLGVWYCPAWNDKANHANSIVVVAYTEDGTKPLGWTTVGEVLRAPICEKYGHANMLIERDQLHDLADL